MENEKYTVKVLEKQGTVTTKDIIKAKDISNTIALDRAVDDNNMLDIGKVIGYVKVEIFNPKSHDEKIYRKLVLICENEDGEKNYYSTGSESFESAFIMLWDEVQDLDEWWSVQVFKKPSKNYSGKGFLTCTLL